MPDIANEASVEVAGRLAWVGMNEIEMPVRIEDDAGGLIQSTALVTAYVNLIDPEVRGIHMSRLYLHLDQGFDARPLNPCTLRQLLRSFLDSHEGLSDRALIRVDPRWPGRSSRTSSARTSTARAKSISMPSMPGWVANRASWPPRTASAARPRSASA
jgi:GTP cyclohydrolase FolE2